MANWNDCVENINKVLSLDPAIKGENELDALAEIMDRQETEDAFVDEDYLPKDGFGLNDSTVNWLIENSVKVPATWQERLNKQISGAKNKTTKEEKEPKKEVTKAVKASEKKTTKKGSKVRLLLDLFEQEFVKGINKKDLLEKIKQGNFQASVNTVKTQLYMCQKVQYNRLSKLVVEKDGFLKFEE